MNSVHMRLYIHFCWHYYQQADIADDNSFIYIIYIYVLESVVHESSDSNSKVDMRMHAIFLSTYYSSIIYLVMKLKTKVIACSLKLCLVLFSDLSRLNDWLDGTVAGLHVAAARLVMHVRRTVATWHGVWRRLGFCPGSARQQTEIRLFSMVVVSKYNDHRL